MVGNYTYETDRCNIVLSLDASAPPSARAGLRFIKPFNLDHLGSASLFTPPHLANATTCSSSPPHLSEEPRPSEAERRLPASAASFLPPAMEREVSFCPKWHGALCSGLFFILSCLALVAEADITCRSCQDGYKWRPQELLLRVETSGPAAGFQGEVWGSGGRTGRVLCEPGSAGCAELSRITDSWSGQPGQGKVGLTSQRFKRDSGGARAPAEGAGAAEERRVPRWSREERRAAGARQEDLKLNSSTFALTGDSAHNQAMVHWSGHNSSVSHPSCVREPRACARERVRWRRNSSLIKMSCPAASLM